MIRDYLRCKSYLLAPTAYAQNQLDQVMQRANGSTGVIASHELPTRSG